MLHHVTLVRTDVSEERIASIIRVKRIGELRTALAVTSKCSIVCLRNVLQLLVISNVIPSSQIFVTLMMVAMRSSETSVLTRSTLRHILEDGILQLVSVFVS
jgi:bacterioferritin-associated ferredoxin